MKNTYVYKAAGISSLFFSCLGVDQFSKQYILWAELKGGLPKIISPFFNIIYATNTGVSFSLFSGHSNTILLLAFAIMMYLVWLMIYEALYLNKAVLSIILAGAVGNCIDRILYGYVVDFLDFHVYGYHYPAFNFADICIVLGGIYYIAASTHASRLNT